MNFDRATLLALAEEAEAEIVRNATYALEGDRNELGKVGARKAASEWAILATTLRRMAK